MAKLKATAPKLPPASEQMKAWSAALATEISEWPKVTVRSFFGFNALYHCEQMFAALPRTRAMLTPNSLFFKLLDADAQVDKRLHSDPRVGTMQMKNVRWYTFELSADSDLRGALDWIGQAYEVARKASRASRGKKKKLSQKG